MASHGTGAAKARKNLNNCNNVVPFNMLNGQKSELRSVKSYKHLGTKTSISCNMAEEVVLRSCSMTTDAKGLNKRVF